MENVFQPTLREEYSVGSKYGIASVSVNFLNKNKVAFIHTQCGSPGPRHEAVSM